MMIPPKFGQPATFVPAGRCDGHVLAIEQIRTTLHIRANPFNSRFVELEFRQGDKQLRFPVDQDSANILMSEIAQAFAVDQQESS